MTNEANGALFYDIIIVNLCIKCETWITIQQDDYRRIGHTADIVVGCYPKGDIVFNGKTDGNFKNIP